MNTKDLLIALWPVLVLQLGLAVAALISISRRGETKRLPKAAWVLIVLFFSMIGPVLYFILGRGELKGHDEYRD